MQFSVPQFIETEDKIIGPFTLKQFFYLAGAGGLSFILFFVLELWLWFIISVPLVGIAAAFALIKIHGQPLTKIARAAFSYFLKPKLILWQQEMPEQEVIKTPEITKTRSEKLQKLIESLNFQTQLKTLWQKIQTTKEAVPGREKPLKQAPSVPEQKIAWEVIKRPTGERRAAKRVDYR